MRLHLPNLNKLRVPILLLRLALIVLRCLGAALMISGFDKEVQMPVVPMLVTSWQCLLAILGNSWQCSVLPELSCIVHTLEHLLVHHENT